MSSEQLIVGYWNMRGLGAPLRSMCMWSGTRFQANCHPLPADIDYLNAKWFKEDKPVLKEKNCLVNLPYVKDGDLVITQTNACMSYLGRKFGLWGTTEVEIIHCEQLLCELYDLRGDMTRLAYGASFDEESARTVVKRQKKNTNLAKLELWLTTNPLFSEETPFLVGGHATAPDFHLFEMLDQYNLLASKVLKEDLFDTLPKLKVFYECWLKHEKMQPYLNSPLHKLPLNNLGASFGSAPGGERYIRGESVPHDEASGVY